MPFQRNVTGAAAVITVMKSMGLNAPASVADSADPTAAQLWVLATQLGQKLIDAHDWQFLQKEFTINTSIGVAAYDLPDDWQSFQEDSMWNRTTRLPAIGSLREYEWQMLKAQQLAGTTFTMLFRVENNQVLFYETPSTVQEIVLPYTSRGWVRKADDSLTDNLADNDDTVLYDSQLFKLGLKLDWLAEKKFDTTRAQTEFDDQLQTVMGRDSPGRTLSIGKGSGYPYLGWLNIPDTGYGGG